MTSQLSAKDGLHNAHVVQYYNWKQFITRYMGRMLANLHYWTMWRLEIGDFDDMWDKR